MSGRCWICPGLGKAFIFALSRAALFAKPQIGGGGYSPGASLRMCFPAGLAEQNGWSVLFTLWGRRLAAGQQPGLQGGSWCP
jgi:hypothetical protein